MSRKKLKLNKYDEKKKIVIPGRREYTFVLARKILSMVAKVPRSKQIRTLGTSDAAVKRKIHSLATHGLMEPLYSYDGLNGTDEMFDGYTRRTAIEEYFETDGVLFPHYELQGKHSVEQIEDLQLYLNQDITDIQGNDKPTIRKVLLERLVNNNSLTAEEKLQECLEVVRNSADTNWSGRAKTSFAKEIFNEINGGNTSILADLDGYTTGLVNKELETGIPLGAFAEIGALSDFLVPNKEGKVFFKSGKTVNGKTVRVLPHDDISNCVGKEGLSRYVNRENSHIPGEEIHWIIFIKDPKGAESVLQKRLEAEEKATKLFDTMMADIKFYIWFFPQIAESVGKVRAEPSSILVKGKKNTYTKPSFGNKVVPIRASGGSK